MKHRTAMRVALVWLGFVYASFAVAAGINKDPVDIGVGWSEFSIASASRGFPFVQEKWGELSCHGDVCLDVMPSQSVNFPAYILNRLLPAVILGLLIAEIAIRVRDRRKHTT